MDDGIRIGHLSTAYHSNFIIKGNEYSTAKQRNHFHWKQFSTGPAIIDAFQKNQLDAAYMGIPPGIIGIDKGIPIKCIAGGHIEGTILLGHGESSPLVFFNDNYSSFFNQFHQKTIGVTRRGSIHDVILRNYLSRFDPDQKILLKNYEMAEMIAYDVYKRKIAAGVGTPALYVFGKSFFQPEILIPPSKFWPYNPSYGIFFNQEYLVEFPNKVLKFLQLHKNACNLLRNNPNTAAKIISSSYPLFTTEYVKEVLKISPHYCAAISPQFIRTTEDFVDYLVQNGIIESKISNDRIFEQSFIKSIHPEQDHYY